MAERRIKARAKKGMSHKPQTFGDLGVLFVERLGDIATAVNTILDLLRADVSSLQYRCTCADPAVARAAGRCAHAH